MPLWHLNGRPMVESMSATHHCPTICRSAGDPTPREVSANNDSESLGVPLLKPIKSTYQSLSIDRESSQALQPKIGGACGHSEFPTNLPSGESDVGLVLYKKVAMGAQGTKSGCLLGIGGHRYSPPFLLS